MYPGKILDKVAWINLPFVSEAGINLLGRDLMSELGIEIKGSENNVKISLNLMTAQTEDKILPEVWDKSRGRLQIPPIHIDLKTPSEII
jgi:hypothetical protein